MIVTASFDLRQSRIVMLPAVRQVLDYLQVEAAQPSTDLLDILVAAYTQRVPWESASRIVRRAGIVETPQCPRWPEEFWRIAMQCGTGGTCFESNYAFFWLLRHLGFRGYLTINDMGETRGCHSAIVVQLDSARYLVDVGIPVYAPVPLNRRRVTQRTTAYHTYTLTPLGDDRYALTRDRHPQVDMYTFIDRPIPEAAYRRATTTDYADGGLFLDRVVVNRVIDGVQWRFDAGEGAPYHLESFRSGDKTYHLLAHDPGEVGRQVAAHFGIDARTVCKALELLYSA